MCWVRTLIFKNFHIFYSLTNKLSKQGKYILLITVSCSFLLEKFCFPNVLVINFFVNVEAMKMVNFLASKKMCWVRTLIFKNFHIFYSLTNYQNIRANASSQYCFMFFFLKWYICLGTTTLQILPKSGLLFLPQFFTYWYF